MEMFAAIYCDRVTHRGSIAAVRAVPYSNESRQADPKSAWRFVSSDPYAARNTGTSAAAPPSLGVGAPAGVPPPTAGCDPRGRT